MWPRVAGALLVAVLVVGGVAFGSWLRGIRQGAPPVSGSVSAQGLRGPVRIVRDPLGVPHVEATGRDDAFFGLGFAHAQDRLWQMELARRAARGTLSELFGERTLAADRLARSLGLARAADREASGLAGRDARALDAYSDGVNRWLEEVGSGRARAPFELVRLDLVPEPWRPADTIALLRLRAWTLSRSLGATLLLDRLVREIGGVASQEFFPDSVHLPDDNLAQLPVHRAADLLAGTVGLRGRVGSSGFAVGPSRTRSGHAILASDPHVQLDVPPVFYVAHLSTPEWEAAGGTWPGVPVFWTGTNAHIAWGQVALFASTSELYEETLQPDDRTRYDANGRWRQAERRVERIAVRGGGEDEIEVLSTRHGPLLGAVDPTNEALAGRALRWTGLGGRSGLSELLAVQRARSWERFRLALRELEAPAATFVYADVDGNIGTQIAGRLPVRSIQTDLLPVPGRSRYYDWRGFIPFDALPRRFGSDLPFLIASPRPASGIFAHPVAWLWHDSAAEERMRSLLARGDKLDLTRAVALQRDRVSVRGPDRIRAWLHDVLPRSRGAARLQRTLIGWDGSSEAQSSGAAVYHAFRMHLTRRLLRERLDPALADALLEASEPVPGALIERFLGQVDPARAQRIAGEVLEETWSWLGLTLSSNPARWTWGELHRIRPRHAFERFGSGPLQWLGRWVSPAEHGAPGDPHSIWTMYSGPEAPFNARVGPGLRLAVDMDDPRHVWVGLAGGQSGHPGSPHFEDALGDWLSGRPRPLWMHPSDVAYHAAGAWDLLPPE